MQRTPSEREIAEQIRAGAEAAQNAAAVRQKHRGKRRPSRAGDLEQAIGRCGQAAEPLRSSIGMVLSHDIPIEIELSMKRTMKALDAERRKLRKML